MKSKILLCFIVLLILQIFVSESLASQSDLQNKKLLKSLHKLNLRKHGSKLTFQSKGIEQAPKPTPIPQELPDIHFDGKCAFNEFQSTLTGHVLTRGEIRSLFRLSDVNKDSKVDHNEWYHFYDLFVKPFENCDTDKDYLLNKDELTKCVQSDQLKGVQIKADQVEEVINILGRSRAAAINFADYIFIRKAKLAWQECATDEGITKIKIACAIEISAPGRTLDLPEGQQVFDIASTLRSGLNSNSVSLVSFLEYLNVAHIFYYFTEFEIPFQDGKIYKKDVLKALDQQRLPTTLNPQIVNQMYDGFDYLNFASWAAQDFAHRLYTRFGKKDQEYLQKDDYNKLLAWKGFNQKLLQMIDKVSIPTVKQIDDSSLLRNNNQYTERDYFINFLQTVHKKHGDAPVLTAAPAPANGDQQDPFKDKKGRDIIFGLLDVFRDGKIRYGIFVDFLKFGMIFQNYDIQSRFLLQESDLINGPKQFESILPLRKNEVLLMNKLTDFIGTKNGYEINLKQFYSWFMADDVLETIRINGNSRSVTRPYLLKGLTSLGLRLARFTMSLAQDGGDFQLKQTAYNFKNAFNMALEDEIIANKVILNTQQQNPDNKLPQK